MMGMMTAVSDTVCLAISYHTMPYIAMPRNVAVRGVLYCLVNLYHSTSCLIISVSSNFYLDLSRLGCTTDRQTNRQANVQQNVKLVNKTIPKIE
jgi:hypothetical protein